MQKLEADTMEGDVTVPKEGEPMQSIKLRFRCCMSLNYNKIV